MSKGINVRLTDDDCPRDVDRKRAGNQRHGAGDFFVECRDVQPKIRQPHPNASLLADHLRPEVRK